MRKVREQKRKKRQAHRSNNRNNEDLLDTYEQINQRFKFNKDNFGRLNE